MNRGWPSRVCFVLLAGCSLLLASHAAAQVANPIEPRWVRIRIPEASLGMEAEALHESVGVGDYTSVHDSLFLVPLIGLRTGGSIYHPNLLTFDFNGEGGWGWLKDTFKSPDNVESRREDDTLRRYLATVSLL